MKEKRNRRRKLFSPTRITSSSAKVKDKEAKKLGSSALIKNAE